MMNRNIVLGFLSLASLTAKAELDLNFHLNQLPVTPVISILRAQPTSPAAHAPAQAIISKPGFVERKVLTAPKLIALPQFKIEKNTTAKVIFNTKEKGGVPTVRPLDHVPEPTIKMDSVNPTELTEISNEEYRLYQGLILSEFQKKYDLAMSAFAELLDDPKFKIQSLYGYAEMAGMLGLTNEFRTKMLQLTKQEDKTYKKKAIESLVKNAEAIQPIDVATIDPLINDMNVDTSGKDAYQIKRAKYYLSEADLAAAEIALHKVSAESPKHPEAALLSANTSYRKGDVQTAISTLEKLTPKIDTKRTDKIRNLAYLTLARMYFQKGNYKTSYTNYLKIDKSSSLWLQSTIEQALTQILAGDHIGAAGNMFSLHTDFFKKAYAPETYIIRTVGYLNLCQYGDAASALSDLSRKYGKTLEQLQNFKAHNPNAPDYYALVKDWFANTEQVEVRSVPRSYIVELARHPNYINLQKQINLFEEEGTRFSGLISSYPAKEVNIRKNISQLKSEISINKSKRANEIQVASMEKKISALELEQQIASRAPQRIEKMKIAAVTKMQAEKEKIKITAGSVLQKRYNEFLAGLTGILEQKDVLSYEIYSGAGEHLRYQMAGGGVKERLPATALTPEEQKSYKWKFRGEVWEDEIGHYRSSLTNVCPDQVAKNSGGK